MSKIEAVFDKKKDGYDIFNGLAEGQKMLILSIRTGMEPGRVEESLKILISAVYGRRTPTQPGVHHNWRVNGVILDFCDSDVSNEATVDFLEEIIEKCRSDVQERGE